MFPVFFAQKTQHEEMAENYIGKMKEVIFLINPNFPKEDAERLAWGGLQETELYKNKGSDFNKNVVNTSNREKFNKSDAKGTICK